MNDSGMTLTEKLNALNSADLSGLRKRLEALRTQADEALRRLRTLDPGFVQSQEQEDLLHALEENLLIRACD